MANWMTPKRIAAKYGLDEEEVLSWKELHEISFSDIGGLVLLDDESVQAYLDFRATYARQLQNRERLLQESDAILMQELQRYDNGAFLVRVQSECFEFYPVVTRALAQLIQNMQKRAIFCSIMKGTPVDEIAQTYHTSEKRVLQLYHDVVSDLRQTKLSLIICQSRVMREQKEKCDYYHRRMLDAEKQIRSLEEQVEEWKKEAGRLASAKLALEIISSKKSSNTDDKIPPEKAGNTNEVDNFKKTGYDVIDTNMEIQAPLPSDIKKYRLSLWLLRWWYRLIRY